MRMSFSLSLKMMMDETKHMRRAWWLGRCGGSGLGGRRGLAKGSIKWKPKGAHGVVAA